MGDGEWRIRNIIDVVPTKPQEKKGTVRRRSNIWEKSCSSLALTAHAAV